jgi:hypothetical protein
MADRPPNLDIGEDSGGVPDRPSPPGVPRWLKVSGIVIILLILVAIGISLLAGLEHGPGRHGAGGDAGGNPMLAGLRIPELAS